ncbi:MAG: hypothetical protein IPM86_16250 [Saprospiraceae bacterium]|nr:hypothetical protein [Saprospiraceae bacterium]
MYKELEIPLADATYIESLYQQYLEHPGSLDPSWVGYFKAIDQQTTRISIPSSGSGYSVDVQKKSLSCLWSMDTDTERIYWLIPTRSAKEKIEVLTSFWRTLDYLLQTWRQLSRLGQPLVLVLPGWLL